MRYLPIVLIGLLILMPFAEAGRTTPGSTPSSIKGNSCRCGLTNTKFTTMNSFVTRMTQVMNRRGDCQRGSIFQKEKQAFYKGAVKAGVNPYFMFALAIQEGGCGTSSIAKAKKNTYGWGAADSDPAGGAKDFTGWDFEKINSHVGSEMKQKWLGPKPRYPPQRKALSQMGGARAPNPSYTKTAEWPGAVANIMSSVVGAKCNPNKACE